jgi:hypothetical protein
LPLSTGQILEEVTKYDNQQKEMKAELLKICWYMRGGVTYEEAHYLTYEDKLLIGDIIEHNMETTKRTGLPFF